MHIQSISQDDGVGKPEYTSPGVHIKIVIIRFQRIARRDKKAFFSNQCKEIEGNNRMGKTRDCFKEIRDIKGKFHAKIGTKRTEMAWT